MAKILYEVKQNQNSFSAAFGKWYAQIKNLETLNTRKLANHISEHGSIYTPDVVYGVLEKFRSCLIEMLLNSKKVKIEGLGTFYCTLENQKNGALKKEDFNVDGGDDSGSQTGGNGGSTGGNTNPDAGDGPTNDDGDGPVNP